VTPARARDALTPRRTARLLLRAPVAADAARLFAIFGDPRTNVHNPDGPYPDLNHARHVLSQWMAHWETHGFGRWAVATLAAPEQVIGFCGVGWRDYCGIQRLNLGYRFAFEAWGQGYATEAGAETLHVALEILAQPEVHAIVRPANLASAHVLQKIGMTEIGTLDDVPGEAPSRMFHAIGVRSPT